MGSSPIRVATRYASVAQLVEQGTENPRVVGSIPTGGTIYADLAHLVERHLAKVEVAGSSPVIRSRNSFERTSFSFRKQQSFSALLLLGANLRLVRRSRGIHLQKEIPSRKDWVFLFGADYGARTRHLHLGKVALYQMS